MEFLSQIFSLTILHRPLWNPIMDTYSSLLTILPLPLLYLHLWTSGKKLPNCLVAAIGWNVTSQSFLPSRVFFSVQINIRAEEKYGKVKSLGCRVSRCFANGAGWRDLKENIVTFSEESFNRWFERILSWLKRTLVNKKSSTSFIKYKLSLKYVW